MASPNAAGRPGEDAYVRRLWGVVRRNPWLGFGLPVLVVAVTAIVVQLMTPIYDAATSIQIDNERPQIGLMAALENLAPLAGGGSDVETEMEVLRSRSLAEAVVDSLELQLVVQQPARARRGEILSAITISRDALEGEYRFERIADGRFRVEATYVPESAEPPLLPWLGRVVESVGEFGVGEPVPLHGGTVTLAPAAAEHESLELLVLPFHKAVRSFRDETSITRPNREARMAVVAYRNKDPELVRDAMNTMAASFIARRADVKTSQERTTVRFLSAQIDTLERELRDAEERLRSFRRSTMAIAPEAEAEAEITRLIQMQSERDVAAAEQSALAALMRDVEAEAATTSPEEPSPYRQLTAFPTILQTGAASELLGMLFQLENQRDSLLVQRTRMDPDVISMVQRIEGVEAQLHTIASNYLGGLTNQIASLDSTLAGYRGRIEAIPDTDIEFARLRRQVEVLGQLYAALQTRLKEAEVAAAVEDVSVRVVDPAIRPVRPVRPQKLISLLLALVLGLVAGVGGAYAREYMDTSLHTRQDVQQATGLPVLGLIPRLEERSESLVRRVARGRSAREAGAAAGERGLVSIDRPGSAEAEAYTRLRTNIDFARPDEPPQAIVFTSAMPGDGKTTTAANLAVTITQQGRRVLLVDADLRRGTLHTLFDEAREPGLSQVLLGRAEPEAVTRRIDIGGGVTFDLLPAGTYSPNPAELLGSDRMHALLQRLRRDYDAVLLDAPPLNLVTDAALLGTNADGALIVVRAGVTDRGSVEYVIEQLRHVRAPVLGTVLNGADHRRQPYGSGQAYEGYTSGRA